MNGRFPIWLLMTVLLTTVSHAQAQQPVKVPRVGYLSSGSLSDLGGRIEGFRQGLRELGYVEGKNIIIEWREAKGNFDRVRELADELVRLKMDVIVSPGPAVTRPLKEATSTIPIVIAQDTDPIGSGFVASLARPGWEHHWIGGSGSGNGRQTTGASERNHTETFACRCRR